MTFIIHFFLAHFLADYPLQSGGLVQLKMKRYWGVFIHGLIHLGVMLIILSPLLHLQRTWVAIGVIYVTHNIIDQLKVNLDKNKPGFHRFLYFLDQFLHWSVIFLMVRYLGDVEPNLSRKWLNIYTNQPLFLYFLVLVVTTYFFDVTRYFINLKKGNPLYSYQRDYRTMALNVFIVSIAFGLYWSIG